MIEKAPTGTADSLGLVTEALIDANDQLLAMYDLAALTSSSLDEETAVGEILDRAKRVVDTDELCFVVEGVVFGEEDRGSASSSRIDVANAAGHAGTLIASRSSAEFGTAESKLLSAIANLCLGASHAARMHAQAVVDAVTQRDHDTASTIAVTALPRWRPSIDGAECFARSDPARSAGGDLFAFGVTGRRVHFVFGDVAGKGLPAAMIMTTVISAATAAFQLYGAEGPARVLRSIDEWVFDHLSESSLFVTLVAGELDLDENRFRLVNAGHSPIYLVNGDVEAADEAGETSGSNDDRAVMAIEADMPPIGVFRVDEIAPTLTCQVFDAKPGDRLVVASDGFTEQCNVAGDQFGEAALESIIGQRSHVSDVGTTLFEMVEQFAGVADQGDDRTVLILGLDTVSEVSRSEVSR